MASSTRGAGTRSLLGAAEEQKLRNIHTLTNRAAEDQHPQEEKLRAEREERKLRETIQRERSSAYWFAASTWGIAGLILGACAGAYMTYVVSVAALPVAQDAIARGMAMENIRSDADGRPTLLDSSPEAPQGR